MLSCVIFDHNLLAVVGKIESNPQQQSQVWRYVQEKARDTVVQVFVQSGIFNWLQPFKSPDFKKSFGSGFFIDKNGYMLTNFHVIDQAQDIKIQIPSLGKEQLDVVVVGICPCRDLALLKLTDRAKEHVVSELGRIPFLVLGDSDRIVRTQEILAMGYPLKQEKLKSTQGIVSGREIVDDESYIQITAALNPGNSGGPSLDANGHVVGINTARMAEAQSIGYITPINDLKSVIKDLYTVPILCFPTLGYDFNYATPNMLQFFKTPFNGGLYLSRVHRHALFQQAGLRAGDMIHMINGQKLDLYGETHVEWSEDKVPMVALLNRFELGQNIDLVFYRDGVKHEAKFQFKPTPQLPIRKYYPGYEPIDYEIIGGMVIMPLTLNHVAKFMAERLKVAKALVKYERREYQDEPKLIVTHLFPTSQAQEARCIKAGDVLCEVNGAPVGTLDEFRSIIKRAYENRHKQEFLTVKTNEQKFMVLKLDQVIKDEPRLAARYVYNQTKLTRDLL